MERATTEPRGADRAIANPYQELAMRQTRRFASLVLHLLLSTAALVNSGSAPAAGADREDRPTVIASADTPQAGQGDRCDPAVFVQKRLTKLKAKLDIRPEQETQWDAFSQTVLQQVEQMKATHQQRKGGPVTAPERIDRRIEMMKQRVAGFEAVGQAAKGLYAVLSPAQQQIADHRLLRWHGSHHG
jgi:protein CpxP